MIDQMVLAAFDQAVAAGDVFAALSSPVIETPPTYVAPAVVDPMPGIRSLRDHAERLVAVAQASQVQALGDQRTVADYGPEAYAAVLKRSPDR